MNRGRSGRSLGDRAASSGITVEPPSVPDTVREEGRHCWVRDPPETPGIWPGLLVEWRRRDAGWEGRVVYTVPRPQGPALVEAWLPAARLEPR
ncbi:hypothetical protein [Blastococcus sp. LR1]|uniref:hypothetical protein n=1 Tax=Blastococcus sp. LR1 TaxID=2877000 RepID=UPI001CC97735|nr:hypothetical protein [Blastococcus sp. LR1]MCA0143407.1 hypothetical protein [Blastococcus sp. LR1]